MANPGQINMTPAPYRRRAHLGGGLALTGGLLAGVAAPAQATARGERPWEEVSLGTSVKSYGAVGDGATDDTRAIQRTVDAVSAQGGGLVAFPAGTYAISGPITVTSDTGEWFSDMGIILVGEGIGSRVRRIDPSHRHSLVVFDGPVGRPDVPNETGGYLRNCGIRSLAIGDSDETAYEPGQWPDGGPPAIVLKKTIQFDISHCIIEQPGGPAIELTDSYIGEIFANIIRLNTDGIVFHGVANALRITSNRIQNNTKVGLRFPPRETTENGYDGRAVSVYIAGNDIEGNGAQAVLFTDAATYEAVTIIGNHIEGNWRAKYGNGDGPYVEKTAGGTFFTGVTLIGNRFLGFTWSEHAVVLEKGTNITLQSNSFVSAVGDPGDRRRVSYRMGPGVEHWFAGPFDEGSIEMDSDVRVHGESAGMVLTSPDSTAYRVTVSDDGQLTTSPA